MTGTMLQQDIVERGPPDLRRDMKIKSAHHLISSIKCAENDLKQVSARPTYTSAFPWNTKRQVPL